MWFALSMVEHVGCTIWVYSCTTVIVSFFTIIIELEAKRAQSASKTKGKQKASSSKQKTVSPSPSPRKPASSSTSISTTPVKGATKPPSSRALSFGDFQALCRDIEGEPSYNAKTKLVRDFIHKDTSKGD